jgi:hypothetical protein
MRMQPSLTAAVVPRTKFETPMNSATNRLAGLV